MHAFLIVNNTNNKPTYEFEKIVKREKISKQIPFILQKIEDSRELKKFVKFSFSQKTAIVIEDIDTATNEALNSFLKNLEEPTKNIIYILTTSNLNNVLPTIVSRCEVVKTENEDYEIENNDELQKFLDSDINFQFEHIGKIKDRGEAVKFIKNIIYLEHQNKIFKNQQNLLNTLSNLKSNGNVSLQLTNFVVTMNR